MTGHMTGHPTGHLTALAATAIGAVPVVSPRRRSRFEPSLDVGLPLAQTISQVVAPIRDAPAKPAAAPRLDHGSEPARRTDEAPVPAGPRSPHPEVATPARRRLVEGHNPAAEPPPRNVSGPPDATPLAPVRVVAPVPEVLVPDAWGGEELVAAGPAVPPLVPTEKAAPHRERPPAVGVLVPRPLPTTAPAPVASAPAAARRSAPPPAEPDVRVTIGRLEVRAGPTAGMPEPARRQAAGLRSLEEYGAARGGGRQ